MMEATPSERRSDVIWAAEQAHGYPTSARIRMMNEALDKYDAPLRASHAALVAALEGIDALMVKAVDAPTLAEQSRNIMAAWRAAGAALDAARNLEGTK
jgi:molybdopterin-guanine dinucleotide biosynthesis protein A